MRLALMFLMAIAVRADEFARYQAIIDRSPFGTVSAAGIAEAPPGFSQQYQFVGLVTSNYGEGPLQAIIFDRNANRTYFRAEGEMLDASVKLERIEREPAKIILKSGLETAPLSYLPRSAAATPVTPQAAGQPPQPVPGSIPIMGQPGQQPPIRRIPFRRGN